MAIDARTLQLIKQKALSGQQMSAPTTEKQAIYDSYKPFDQNAYLKTQQDQVNSVFNNQASAQMAQFTAQRDKALGRVNQQKAEVAPQYMNKRNQADVVSAQNMNRLREMMANNGISASGENVTANVALGSARQGALSELNLQEQETNNDFNRQISEINDPAELNAMMAQIEAQRSQALNDATNRANEIGYSRQRDSVMDNRYVDETQYGRGRDTVQDNRYIDETKYERALQLAEDKRRAEALAYSRQQDAIARSRRGGSGGGGSYGSSSYGGSAKAPQTKLPSNPTGPKIINERQYIDAFEQSDARKAGTARVLPGSTDYAKKMQKVLSDLYK